MTVAQPEPTAAYLKPPPNIDEDIRPFWDGLSQHRFLLYRCRRCGAWYWPAAYCRKHPPAPFQEEMEWTEASRRGSVFSFNIHHWAFEPSFKAEVPYVYALIELEEGPMFGTNVIGCRPEEVRVGMPVEIVFEDHPEAGFTLPKARPAGASSSEQEEG